MGAEQLPTAFHEIENIFNYDLMPFDLFRRFLFSNWRAAAKNRLHCENEISAAIRLV